MPPAMAARAGVPILPMVKADGYGLGALAVVRALEPLSPWGYGVATVEEGAELRRTPASAAHCWCSPRSSKRTSRPRAMRG